VVTGRPARDLRVRQWSVSAGPREGAMDRRRFLQLAAMAGLGSVANPGDLLAQYRFLDPVRVPNPLAEYPKRGRASVHAGSPSPAADRTWIPGSPRRKPHAASRAIRVFRCTPSPRAARLWFQSARSSARST